MDPIARESLSAQVAQTPGAYVVDNVDRHITPREVMRMLEPFQHRVCVIDFDDDCRGELPDRPAAPRRLRQWR